MIDAPTTESATAPLETAVREILSRLKPVSNADWRRSQFKHDIAPRLASLGFEPRFREELHEWNNEKQAVTFRQCDSLLQGCGAIVALVGERGTGKTTIAAQLAVQRVRQWLDYYALEARERPARVPLGMPYYRKATDILTRFKSLYADFGSINANELTEQRAYQCHEWPLLIIDEWHDTEDQKLRDRIMVDLIDRRYASLTDTLIISNQSAEDFSAKTNPSILSRLEQHGRVISCKWDSWRKHAKGEKMEGVL